MKTLIAVTTFNQLDMTRKCLSYLDKLDYNILVIDDHSDDRQELFEYLRGLEIDYFPKPKRSGLTHSWNIVYDMFKNSNYDYVILMNNDVLIPDGAIANMLSDYPLVVPMTSFEGAGYKCKNQAVEFVHNLNNLDPVKIADMQNIQDSITGEFKKALCWTGFCMCFSRKIIEYEREDGNLFDPGNINTGNDDDLAKRVPAYIALGSFVYHFKGTSFNGKIAGRNKI